MVAALCGWAAEAFRPFEMPKAIAANIVFGLVVLYALGVLGMMVVAKLAVGTALASLVAFIPGDLVKCDVGVCTLGFNGDTSRTVMVGVTDPEVIRLVETTKRCLAAGIAAAGPGVHLGDVGYAIQKVAEDAGFGIVRDWIGHGVGRTVHEDPEVPNYGKPGTKLVLRPGMTIAIEPMITLTTAGAKTYVDKANGWTVITRDHCMAAHFEHTVAITDDGCEVLTVPADYP